MQSNVLNEVKIGAIMFNDPLSSDQCRSLMRRLSETRFPFICAHGRFVIKTYMNFKEFKFFILRPSILPLPIHELSDDSHGSKHIAWDNFSEQLIIRISTYSCYQETIPATGGSGPCRVYSVRYLRVFRFFRLLLFGVLTCPNMNKNLVWSASHIHNYFCAVAKLAAT